MTRYPNALAGNRLVIRGLLALAALPLLSAAPAWGLDSDEDGLDDAAEVSRSREHTFATHLIADEYPGDTPGVSGAPATVALGDLDGDGDDDALASWNWLSPGLGEVHWYRNRLNEPSRDFVHASHLFTRTATNSLELAAIDLDGDEDLDVVYKHLVLSVFPRQVAVHWNENRLDEETADFGPGVAIPPSGLGDVTFDVPILFEDLDGDEDPDFVWASNQLAWSENRLDEAEGDFGPARQIDSHAPSGGFTPGANLRVADLDRDSDLDVVYSTLGDCRIAWYENRLDEASLDFAPGRELVSGEDGALLVGVADLDVDGWPDVLGSLLPSFGIEPCFQEPKGASHWYASVLGEAAPGFGPATPITDWGTGFLEAADLDGDEDPDLIGGHFDSIGYTVMAHQNRLGEPAEPFTPLELDFLTLDGSSSNGQVWLSDLDGDGDVDFLAASSSAGAVWVENPGTDPQDPDSDGDSHLDGAEVLAGSDPNDPTSTPAPEPGTGIGMLAAMASLAGLARRGR